MNTKSTVLHAYSPSIPEVEGKGSGVQSRLGLLSKSEARLSYVKSRLSVESSLGIHKEVHSPAPEKNL